MKAVQFVLVDGLTFLNELGPARLMTLLAGVKMDRLVELAGKLPRAKMLRLLKETRADQITAVIAKMHNEDIIY